MVSVVVVAVVALRLPCAEVSLGVSEMPESCEEGSNDFRVFPVLALLLLLPPPLGAGDPLVLRFLRTAELLLLLPVLLLLFVRVSFAAALPLLFVRVSFAGAVAAAAVADPLPPASVASNAFKIFGQPFKHCFGSHVLSFAA